MTITLRIILILASTLSFILCVRKIKKSELKIENSIIWLLGSLLLILMSVFSNAVTWISSILGFEAPVNFVWMCAIGFLLIEIFLDNIDNGTQFSFYLPINITEEKINNPIIQKDSLIERCNIQFSDILREFQNMTAAHQCLCLKIQDKPFCRPFL